MAPSAERRRSRSISRSLKNPGGSRYERRTRLRRVPSQIQGGATTRYRAYRGGAATPEMLPRRRNGNKRVSACRGAWGLAGADLHSLRSLRLWPNTASLVVEGTARSVVAQGIDSSSFLVFNSQDGNRRDSDCRARPTRVLQRPAYAPEAPAGGSSTSPRNRVSRHDRYSSTAPGWEAIHSATQAPS